MKLATAAQMRELDRRAIEERNIPSIDLMERAAAAVAQAALDALPDKPGKCRAAVFCGATNCPLSSVFLALELFGSDGLPLYALCCGVAYMLSGYHGLYSEQKIIYSKFKPEWLDKKAE